MSRSGPADVDTGVSGCAAHSFGDDETWCYVAGGANCVGATVSQASMACVCVCGKCYVAGGVNGVGATVSQASMACVSLGSSVPLCC